MREKLMDALQRFSKAMFIPVLILPIAGILIAVGNLFTNAKLIEVLPFMDNAVTKGFGTLLSGSLVSILNNLGLIFCVGIAVGLAVPGNYPWYRYCNGAQPILRDGIQQCISDLWRFPFCIHCTDPDSGCAGCCADLCMAVCSGRYFQSGWIYQ